jgi:glycosyltransferase involved in cell wall biosynthesis
MQVYYLSTGLQAMGVENLVVTPLSSPLYNLLQATSVGVKGIHYYGDLDLTLIFRLMSIIRKFRPDIIHIHSRRGADTLGLFAASLVGIGKIIVSRRVDDPLPSNWLTRWRYKTWPDHVIAVSKGIKRALVEAGIPEDDISQVYSSINFEDYQVNADKAAIKRDLGISAAHVVAVIGQLIPRKGHRFLLRAAPQILSAVPDTAFLFLGEGKEHENLVRLTKKLGLEEKVVFAGYRDDVGEILNCVDVLVHPATMEGFANVAMQAMAAEIPVVSSAVGGMPESVLDGQTGLLVEPGKPDQIAHAVLRLLQDADYRKKLGRQGRQFVEREFTIENMVRRTLAIYEKQLGR